MKDGEELGFLLGPGEGFDDGMALGALDGWLLLDIDGAELAVTLG